MHEAGHVIRLRLPQQLGDPVAAHSRIRIAEAGLELRAREIYVPKEREPAVAVHEAIV